MQGFNGRCVPSECAPGVESPARVLDNLLDLPGFDQASAVSADKSFHQVGGSSPAAWAMVSTAYLWHLPVAIGGLQRIADVPIHFADADWPAAHPRAAEGQNARCRAPTARMAPADSSGGCLAGDRVHVSPGRNGEAIAAQADEGLLRVAAGHASTAALGAMFGAINVERAWSMRCSNPLADFGSVSWTGPLSGR